MVIEAKAVKGSLKGLEYQANDKGQAKEICRGGLYGDDPKDWNRQMREIENLNDDVKNKRAIVVIAPSKDVSWKLSDDDWRKLVDDYFKKEGIDQDNVQYIAHTHESTDDKHLHLNINRVDFNGKNQIQSHKIGERAGKHADEMCKERGWRTAKEVAQGRKTEISQAIREETAKSKNFEELTNNLYKRGYILNLNYNAKGLNGARVIPKEDIKKENEPISRLEELAGKGYKLSDIDRKLKIGDIEKALNENYKKALEREKPQEKSKEQRISDIKDFRMQYEFALNGMRQQFEKGIKDIDLQKHLGSYKIDYDREKSTITYKGESYSSNEIEAFKRNGVYFVEQAQQRYNEQKQRYDAIMNKEPKEVPSSLNIFKSAERREALEYNEQIAKAKQNAVEPKLDVKIDLPTSLNMEMYKEHRTMEQGRDQDKDLNQEQSMNMLDKLFERSYNEEQEEEQKKKKRDRGMSR